MSALDVIQLCADRGIAPGSTKGAAQHLRGIAAGLVRRGHHVTTHSARRAEGPHPVTLTSLAAIDELDGPVDAEGRRRVVYERYSLGHRGGLELAERLGAPFVLEVNAPLVDEARRHRPATVGPDDATIEAELIARADLVITVSSVLTAWAAEERSGPTVTVPNGVEPAWFTTPATPDATDAPLVFIGHPKPWHGADRLVELLVALAEVGRHPDLLVIGGGQGADDLRDSARVAGVGPQVTITGALAPAEASGLLRRGAIGLAPYRRQDPFYFCPLKVVDYLAAGLPVVASDQGDVAALVGDAGVVFDADDDGQLVTAVAALLDDPARRAELGRRGRSRAMSSMTWDDAAHRTEVALRSILAELVPA